MNSWPVFWNAASIVGQPRGWNSGAVAPKSASLVTGGIGAFDAVTARLLVSLTTCSANAVFCGLANALPVRAYTADPPRTTETPPGPQMPPPFGPLAPVGYHCCRMAPLVTETSAAFPWYGVKSQALAVVTYSDVPLSVGPLKTKVLATSALSGIKTCNAGRSAPVARSYACRKPSPLTMYSRFRARSMAGVPMYPALPPDMAKSLQVVWTGTTFCSQITFPLESFSANMAPRRGAA